MWTGPDLWHDRCIEELPCPSLCHCGPLQLRKPSTFPVSWDSEPEGHWVPQEEESSLEC